MSHKWIAAAGVGGWHMRSESIRDRVSGSFTSSPIRAVGVVVSALGLNHPHVGCQLERLAMGELGPMLEDEEIGW